VANAFPWLASNGTALVEQRGNVLMITINLPATRNSVNGVVSAGVGR
jgi:enoyl-CoA hydratase/carnithine racemase